MLLVRRFRKAGYAAIDRVCDYYESIESLNVMPDVKPGDTSKLLSGQHQFETAYIHPCRKPSESMRD